MFMADKEKEKTKNIKKLKRKEKSEAVKGCYKNKIAPGRCLCFMTIMSSLGIVMMMVVKTCRHTVDHTIRAMQSTHQPDPTCVLVCV